MRMLPISRRRSWVAGLLALTALLLPGRSAAQEPGRVLSRADIEVYGLLLKVTPETQTVPKDFATIVSAYVQAPGDTQPDTLPPFAVDAEVRATLRGPGLASPRELVTRPGTPFDIPAMARAGTYTLENIRLVSQGEVLLYGTPDRARIDVIDQLLVTSVSARPLTADEIREKGIVYDRDSFQAYNFAAAFAIEDGSRIDIQFPVVLPTLLKAVDPSSKLNLAGIDVPLLRTVQTLVPDTLKIQARIPNLSVVGFTLTLDQAASSQSLVMPPIPGVIVIPGDIGFLNQFFSVTLLVGNVAPSGSGLEVHELQASISLPPGVDRVVGSADDPLRLARTSTGTAANLPVIQAGPDGQFGTGDDVLVLGPEQTGQAEFLVEGLREGTHVIEMELGGVLHGMPVGPVPIRGRAAGAVLVRNPSFTLTFTHPDVVNAGEPYTLDVTVTNTSGSPANFVSLNLFGANVSGATLTTEASQAIEQLRPGDSATVSYGLVAQRTGKVTAATLDSNENVSGRFLFRTAIGELGVPLSPDSLVLPQEASGLPPELREAVVGLLGRAWAVATAPAAAVPPDLIRFSRQVVIDRAIQAATTGLRLSLGEPGPRAIGDLWLDLLGSEYTQLASRVPTGDTTGLLELLERDVRGFDLVRRRSFRGQRLADVIGQQIAAGATPGASWHEAFAEQMTSRPGHVSILLSGPGAESVDGLLVDPAGLRVGDGGDGTTVRELPYGDVAVLRDGTGPVTGRLFVVAVPETGVYELRLRRASGASGDVPVDVSIAVPATDGTLRFLDAGAVQPGEIVEPGAAALVATRVRVLGATGATTRGGAWTTVADPVPTVLAARQISAADILGCTQPELAFRQTPAGRVFAVLFSEQVTPESVQDRLPFEQITAFAVEGTRVASVALQPGRRMAYVALREGIGPFVERSVVVTDVKDARGQSTGTVTVPIVTTVGTSAAVVAGQVRQADGTVLAGTSVRLFYEFQCGEAPSVIGVAEDIADANGRYQFDYVLSTPDALRLVAVDPETNDVRRLAFSISRPGQHLNADIVFVGRGTLTGRTLAEDGVTPLGGTQLRITSLTDQSQYGAESDAAGVYRLERVPVGNVLIEAVNVDRGAQVMIAESIPFAGGTTTRDLVLLDVGTGPTIGLSRLSGRVVRFDGVTAAPRLPVVAYYLSNSQQGLDCPKPPGNSLPPTECAVAMTTTADDGSFDLPGLPAGVIRIDTFDNGGLEQGGVRVTLQPAGESLVTVVLGGGFGTVRGVVVDASGAPVSDAVVGGGLSLVNVNPADGTFVLNDVPVGRRQIVAVSESIRGEGSVSVDLPLAGDEVFARVVLSATGAVAGVVRDSNGVAQANARVWVFEKCYDELQRESICVQGETRTGADGSFRIGGLGIGTYQLSAFRPDLRDGNIATFAVRFDRQTVVTNITYRGGTGTVTGRVLRAENCDSPPCIDTPLPARVGISGDRLVMAGGQIPVRFEYVQNFAVRDNDPGTGAFTFDGVFVGPFTVRAAGLFSPEPVSGEGTIPTAGATANVDLRLQPTSRVTGTVLEPDGVEPVRNRQIALKFQSNATIVVCTEDQNSGDSDCVTLPQGIQEAFATTDENGRFSYPIVNPGPFTLTATDAAQGRTATVRGHVRPGETADVPMRLLGRSSVTVRVMPANGTTPIAGARVEVRSLSRPDLVREGVTPTGTITFAGADALDEGAIVVMAMGPNGFAGRASAVVPTTDAPVSLDVYLDDATGTVTGLVTKLDSTGTPQVVPNAEVVLARSGTPLAFALTDGEGRYTVPLIRPGDIAADAFDPVTASRGRATGTVLAGTLDTTVDVPLDSLGLIRGIVVDASTRAPMRGWRVTLSQVSSTGRALPQQVTQTTVDGSFSFPGVTVGSFSLRASVGGVSVVGQASGTVSRGGQLVDVTVPVTIVREVTGRVRGTITYANGQAVPNAQVSVCATGKPCLPTTADGAGQFLLEGIALGRVLVNAQAQVTGGTSLGQAGGTLLFEGDTLDVAVSLVDTSVVEGTVVQVVNGVQVPAVGATVRLTGSPAGGCASGCQQSADQDGRFRFTNVAARTFTVTAVGGGGQQGSTGGVIDAPGLISGVQVVIAPSISITGRAVLPDGSPASGVVAEFSRGNARLFDETDADGAFAFTGISLGAYTVALQDPIGGGLARRTGSIASLTPVELGNVELDTTAPAVATTTPGTGEIGVSRTPTITITFTERVAPATVTAANIALSGPDGPVTTLLALTDGDRAVRLTLLPGAQLADQTRYTLRVQNVADLVNRPMPAEYVANFTTVDVTPPSVTEATPAAGGTGVSLDAVVRIRFNEAVNRAAFTGPAIVVTNGGAPVDGRIDFTFGDTVAIFTPTLPLVEGVTYAVQVAAATDLVGQQGEPLSFSFTATDRTPPVVTALVPASPTVIQGTVIVADAVLAPADVALVDFYVGSTLVFTDRAAPFQLALQATPAFGTPGSVLTLSAFAIDTSGNRSVVPAQATVTIVADTPPTATMPTLTASVVPGQRLSVTLTAADDVGVASTSLLARLVPPSSGAVRGLVATTRPYAPATRDRQETFEIVVPADAAAGSTVTVEASAIDTAGQVVQTALQSATVADTVGPTIAVTGVTAGQRISAGQVLSVVVSAEDPAGVAQIVLRSTGVVSRTDTRPVSPALPSAATTFAITVPSSVATGEALTFTASARDTAGNETTASQITLVVGDVQIPTVSLLALGGLDVTPGVPATIRVTGNDDAAVGQLRLTGTGPGGYAFDESRSTAPTSPASADFVVPIPATLADGDTIVLTARATDTSANLSATASLTLTARGLTTVTLPGSLLVRAGADETFTVGLGTPAPTGGLTVTFVARTAGRIQVPAPVVFPAGSTTQSATLRAVAGGITQVDALINGVVRESMTVSIVGGVVRGLVQMSVDGQPGLQPAAGAQVTVFHGGPALVTTTDGQGRFEVDSVNGSAFSVRAGLDGLLGYVDGSLDVSGGSGEATVVLLPAGTFTGTLMLSDGVTPAPANVEVTLAEAASPTVVIRRERTDDQGRWQFTLVAPGPYVIEAADLAGNRARSNATASAGVETPVPLAYLGKGSVTGIVRTGAGQPVANATVELFGSSLFGAAPVQTRTTGDDGRFSFTSVFVGDVTVRARDVLNQGGVATGTITQAGQTIDLTVSLAPFGSLVGTVYRQDGATPVPGASVTVRMTNGAQFTSTTQPDGTYRFDVLPFLGFTVTARETATRGVGIANGAFASSGETLTRDVTLLPQGSVLVQVLDADGQPVNGASVTAAVTGYGLDDSRTGATTVVDGVPGRVLLDRLLEGSLTVTASANGLSGRVTDLQVVRDAVTQVEVRLEPQGTIAGRVYEADGATPASGTVRVYGANNFQRALALENGQFSTDLRLGTYSLVAFDASGRRRAETSDIVLAANAQVETRDLVFVAVGTVTGRVLHPTQGGDVSGLTVSLQSLHPQFGGFRSTTTNPAGLYTITDVPYGVVRVNVVKSSESLQGESSGVVQSPSLSLDVLLQNNSVTLPVTLNDVNDSSYAVIAGGGLGGGTRSVFAYGSNALEVERDGVRSGFTGTTFATRELGGRQLVVRQQGLHGLTVTRKTYVPTTGYFARHLEVLTNPTETPITVGVHVTTRVAGFWNGFGSYVHFQVGGSSSGDSVIDPGLDRWITLDGFGSDGYYNSTGSSRVTVVLDGEGAPEAVDAIQFTPSTWNSSSPGVLTYGWQSITVPAGGQVALMHVTGQQANAVGAIASAERLSTVPPELLDGLTPSDLASVVNFTLPADGLSTQPALPVVTGAVSGRVFEGDGTTPVSGAQVRLRSASGVHAREWFATSAADGSFSFTGMPQRPVPLVDVLLDARHPLNSQYVVSPTVTTTFAEGATTLAADVPFSNTGVLLVTVRNNGVPVSGATVELVSYATRSSNAAGQVEFRGTPADQSMTLRGSVSHPQGTALSLVQLTTTIPPGQTTPVDLLVEPTGAVTGLLTNAGGAPQANRPVTLLGGATGNTFQRTTTTDSSGRFAFPDVRVGTARVRATDPLSNFTTEVVTAVLPNQATDIVVRYIGNGTITTTVTRANGTPLAGMRVQVSGTTFSRPQVLTDANGVAVVTDVPLDQVATIVATHPSNTAITASTTRTLTVQGGGQASATIALPAFGEVTGLVRTAAGNLTGSGTSVQLSGTNLGTSFSATTSSDSRYTFGPIPTTATFTVDTLHPTARRSGFSIPRSRSVSQRITTDAQVIALDTFHPAIATLNVRVREADGAPVTGARVQVRDALNGFFEERGTTNASGDLLVPFVVETAELRIFRGTGTTPNEIATVPIPRANDGQTIDATVVIRAFTVTFHGRFYEADGITPLASTQSVQLLRPVDRTVLRTVCINGPNCFPTGTSPGPGEFRITDFALSGGGVIVRVLAPFGGTSFNVHEQLVVPTGNGLLETSMVLPYVKATISGRVLAADGVTPVTTGTVWPIGLNGYNHFGGPVSETGTYLLQPGYVPTEGLRLRYTGPGLPSNGVEIQTGPIAPTTNQALTFDITLSDRVFTTVTGRLLAGDGATPLPNANVRLDFFEGTCSSCNTNTSADGRFSLAVLLPSSGNARLTASTYVANSPTATRDIGQLAQGSTTDVGDIVLPISAMKGRVTFGPTIPAPSAEVFARSATGQYFYAQMTESDYLIVGAKAGTYTLIATQYPSGLTVEREVVLPADDAVIVEDLQLPEVASVRVRLFVQAGVPLWQGGEVALRGPDGLEIRCGEYESVYPESGVCNFEFVPLGGYYAQGKWEECEEIYDEENDEYIYQCTPARFTSGIATLTEAGQTATIDLFFDRENHVDLDLSPGYIQSGQAVRVRVVSEQHGGPLGAATSFYETVVPDDHILPVGPIPIGKAVVFLEAYNAEWDYWDAYARVELTVPPAVQGRPTIPVFPGGVSGEYAGMYGQDRYLYGLGPQGQLRDSGYLTETFQYLNGGGIDHGGLLSVDHETLEGWTVSGNTGLRATYGPMASASPIVVTRKIELPAAGGYLYALDTFSNPTDLELTIRVDVRNQMRQPSIVASSTASQETAGWLVYDNANLNQVSVGLLYAGADAPMAPAVSFDMTDWEISGDHRPRFTYTLTIPARASRSLLTFWAIDAPADAGEITTRLQSIAADPRAAAAGLTATERARVVNFRLEP